jgi:dihydroflavonol-4-reductase
MAPTKGIVTVTGANGFVASHIIKLLLEKGYTVHGTVRSLANKNKFDFLYKLPHASTTNLKLFEADLSQVGSYDEAIKDSTIVFHTASPVVLSAENPQRDIIDPAIDGTLTVLRSAAKSPTVKRVVITGSGAALYDPLTPNIEQVVFNETHWNTDSSAERNPYNASKVAAEKAAWAYIEKNKRDISFDLVFILPTFVVGPVLQDSTTSQLNVSSDLFLNFIKSARDGNPIDNSYLPLIDVKDLAHIHLLAGTTEQVSNQRIIAHNVTHNIVELIEKLSAAFPEDFTKVDFNNVSPQAGIFSVKLNVDNSKLKKSFPSFKLTDINDTLVDYFTAAKKDKLIQ